MAGKDLASRMAGFVTRRLEESGKYTIEGKDLHHLLVKERDTLSGNMIDIFLHSDHPETAREFSERKLFGTCFS